MKNKVYTSLDDVETADMSEYDSEVTKQVFCVPDIAKPLVSKAKIVTCYDDKKSRN